MRARATRAQPAPLPPRRRKARRCRRRTRKAWRCRTSRPPTRRRWRPCSKLSPRSRRRDHWRRQRGFFFLAMLGPAAAARAGAHPGTRGGARCWRGAPGAWREGCGSVVGCAKGRLQAPLALDRGGMRRTQERQGCRDGRAGRRHRLALEERLTLCWGLKDELRVRSGFRTTTSIAAAPQGWRICRDRPLLSNVTSHVITWVLPRQAGLDVSTSSWSCSCGHAESAPCCHATLPGLCWEVATAFAERPVVCTLFFKLAFLTSMLHEAHLSHARSP